MDDASIASAGNFSRGIVLCLASRSLIFQIVDWNLRFADCPLLCIPRRAPHPPLVAVANSDRVLVDATEDPDLAGKIVTEVTDRLRGARLIVYTERAAFDLERIVRQRGVQFVDGPMDPDAWEEFLSREQMNYSRA